LKDIPIFNIKNFFVGRVMTQGLVAGLSPGKLDFSIWLICVGFVVGTLLQGFFFSEHFGFVLLFITPPMLRTHNSFIYLRRYIIAAFASVIKRRKKSFNASISTLPGIL